MGSPQLGGIFQREKRGDLRVWGTGDDQFQTMNIEQAEREGSGKQERGRKSSLLTEKNRKGRERALLQPWVTPRGQSYLIQYSPFRLTKCLLPGKRLTGNCYRRLCRAWQSFSTLSSY